MLTNLFLGQTAEEKLYVEDVFSTWLYTGNGSTQTITNGIALGDTVTAPVGYFATNTGLSCADSTDLRFDSMEDFTVECWVNQRNYSSNQCICLKGTGFGDPNNFGILSSNVGQWNVWFNGEVKIYGSNIPETNKWFHVAVCRSGTTVRLFVNGQDYGSASYSGAVSHAGAFKIGTSDTGGFQYQLQGSITNFRLVKGTALYTSNFTPPSSPLTAVSNTKLLVLQNPSLFTDNSGLGRVVTNYGVSSVPTAGPFSSPGTGKGGLVWVKARAGETYGGNVFVDTARGRASLISSSSVPTVSSTEGAYTSPANTDLVSFNSNGFTLGSDNWWNKNTNGQPYASWTFRKAPKFFDVVTWTSNGSSTQTLNHALGVLPGMIIAKRTDSTSNWFVWHRGNGGGVAGLSLNATNPAYFPSGAGSAATTTTFRVDDLADHGLNQPTVSGATYVAYLFAHDTTADGVIQCGSFTKDGSNNATVTLGWEPQYVLVKSTNGSGVAVGDSWLIADIMRGANESLTNYLRADLSNADATNGGPWCVPTATGFKIQQLSGGSNHIYLAIRRGPMRVPTDATKVFAPVDRTGTGGSATISGVGFAPDTYLSKARNQAYNPVLYDKLRGYRYLLTSSTGSEPTSDGGVTSFNNDGVSVSGGSGFGLDGSGDSIINWFFRRAPGFFDVVCYTGTNYVNPVKSHNLGVTPEFILVKRRDTSTNWFALHTPAGLRYSFYLNNQGPIDYGAGSNIWAPTSTTFTASAGLGLDASGGQYVAYLFASVPGVSKVGTYIGTGSTAQNVDCGFTNGARFVLIKANAVAGTTADGGWAMFDTARGINVGNDPILWLNYTYAEYNTYNHISPFSAGFKVEADNGNSGLNASGVQYIYLAIA